MNSLDQTTAVRDQIRRRLRRLAGAIAVALSITVLALASLFVPAVRAEDSSVTGIPDPSIATSLPQSLADPAGIRRSLAERGITFGANYIGEYFGVASGGLERDAYYDGRLELVLDADLGKLAGLSGLTFHANGYQIHGESITAEALGSLAPASYIEAEPSTRLFEIYLEQSLMDGALTIRAGQIALDSEFAITESSAAFINGTWGYLAILANNLPGGGPAYPIASPGVRVAINPEGDAGFMAAVYNADLADDCPSGDFQRCNPHGLDFPIGGGAVFAAEGFLKYSLASGTLPGRIKLGGWAHTVDTPDLIDPSTVYSGSYGLYAIWDQTLLKPASGVGRVDLFAQFAASPSDRNEIDLYAAGGLVVYGPFASRPNDTIGIGYAYMRISGDARAADVLSGETIIRDYEGVLELSYTAQIVPGFTLQPDLQYFWNPGGRVPDATGTRAVEDALVLGIRSTINY